jgi:membrane fusion protein, multidrug efflux system
MNKRIKFFITLTVIVVITGLILYPKLRPLFSKPAQGPAAMTMPHQRSLNVDALVMKPQRLVELINSSGTLLPDEQVDLSFETSGKIVNINFEEGRFVKKGDLLAKINDQHLQAQLLKLQAQKKLSEEREFRQRSLLSRDAISQESYDQAVTELQTLDADIMLVQARIAETELRAPFDGIIGLRNLSEGSFANPSSSIARLVKVNPLKIEFSVPERYSGGIKPGFPIRFMLDGNPDTLRASVYAVDPKVDIRTRNITVRALFPNTTQVIKPGRFVAITLELSETNDALAIPSEALIPEMEGDKVFVYRSGKANSVSVSTGMRTADKIQITHGLNPGDTVLTTGVMQLREGMNVVIDFLN